MHNVMVMLYIIAICVGCFVGIINHIYIDYNIRCRLIKHRNNGIEGKSEIYHGVGIVRSDVFGGIFTSILILALEQIAFLRHDSKLLLVIAMLLSSIICAYMSFIFNIHVYSNADKIKMSKMRTIQSLILAISELLIIMFTLCEILVLSKIDYSEQSKIYWAMFAFGVGAILSMADVKYKWELARYSSAMCVLMYECDEIIKCRYKVRDRYVTKKMSIIMIGILSGVALYITLGLQHEGALALGYFSGTIIIPMVWEPLKIPFSRAINDIITTSIITKGAIHESAGIFRPRRQVQETRLPRRPAPKDRRHG